MGLLPGLHLFLRNKPSALPWGFFCRLYTRPLYRLPVLSWPQPQAADVLIYGILIFAIVGKSLYCQILLIIGGSYSHLFSYWPLVDIPPRSKSPNSNPSNLLPIVNFISRDNPGKVKPQEMSSRTMHQLWARRLGYGGFRLWWAYLGCWGLQELFSLFFWWSSDHALQSRANSQKTQNCPAGELNPRPLGFRASALTFELQRPGWESWGQNFLIILSRLDICLCGWWD